MKRILFRPFLALRVDARAWGGFFYRILVMGLFLLNDCHVRRSDVRIVDVCGTGIGFVVADGRVWFEVSSLKKDENDVEKWLASPEATAFMDALTKADPCRPASAKVQKVDGEVWLQDELAAEYARWLSAEIGIGLRRALEGIPTFRWAGFGVIRNVYSQERTSELKASGNASVDDGYAVMLPYLFEWIGGYDITVLEEGTGKGIESGSTYLMFKRFLDRRRIPYPEAGLYVSNFLKKMGIPYTRNKGYKGWKFLIRMEEKYEVKGEEA